MKFNLMKVATYASTTIDGITYKYGWYHSSRAFIAKEDEVMTFGKAYSELAPKTHIGYYDSFYCKENGQYYKKTLDGLVRYLMNKYSK